MQKILSVNLSKEPAEAVLVGVSEKSMKIIERHEGYLNGLLDSWRDEEPEDTAETSGEEQEDSPDTLSGDNNSLGELLNSFSESWSSSILIVPSEHYLSLNITLPFADEKSIDKVIDLEVQDLVPFDVEEFLVGYSVLGVNDESPSLFDVHVCLIPKRYIKGILKVCKESQFEPVAITSPASALASFYHAAPNYFAENASLIYMDDATLYSCSAFNGIVSEDRAFQSKWIVANGSEPAVGDAQLKELKVALASLENKHSKNVDKIYVLGGGQSTSTLQNSLGRSVELLDPSDITRGANSVESSITAGAAIFVRDINPPALLSNFRTREFAFRPQLKEVLKGLKTLTPYLGLTILLLIGFFLSTIALNQYQIQQMRATISDKIAEVAPAAADKGTGSIAELNALAQKVQAELDSLGAPSAHSPLDVFNQLSKEIEKGPAVEISTIRITNSRVELRGTAESYAKADELRKIFKRNGEMYCKVDRDNASSAGGSRGFKYDLELCH